jgi:hypothetical protein
MESGILFYYTKDEGLRDHASNSPLERGGSEAAGVCLFLLLNLHRILTHFHAYAT